MARAYPDESKRRGFEHLEIFMVKEQKRGNREIRKPKAIKKPVAEVAGSARRHVPAVAGSITAATSNFRTPGRLFIAMSVRAGKVFDQSPKSIPRD